jgi:phosphate/sulfate permease
MFKSKKYYINSEKGFALVLALIACLILFALGALVINMSIGDILTSSQILGNKRAVLAAEKGVNRLLQNFNADNVPTGEQTTLAADLAVDPHSTYTISVPDNTGFRSMTGYTSPWGMVSYGIDVTGQNTAYSNTHVTIRVGLGYGPIDTSLIYK